MVVQEEVEEREGEGLGALSHDGIGCATEEHRWRVPGLLDNDVNAPHQTSTVEGCRQCGGAKHTLDVRKPPIWGNRARGTAELGLIRLLIAIEEAPAACTGVAGSDARLHRSPPPQVSLLRSVLK